MNNPKKSCCTLLFLIVIFIAVEAAPAAQTIELDYNFHRGTLGWTADFAGYAPWTNQTGIFELFSGLRYMPRKSTRVPRRGFYIQGNNRSDGLFMFLKRRLTAEDGIVAGRSYRIEYVITLASNAASGCAGAGGAPGESVYLKAGGSSIEPIPVMQPDGLLTMNVIIGTPASNGTAASYAGNIANDIDCEVAYPNYPFALIQRSVQHATNVNASVNGELWLLVGTVSAFEGLTRLYYQSIRVKLTPV